MSNISPGFNQTDVSMRVPRTQKAKRGTKTISSNFSSTEKPKETYQMFPEGSASAYDRESQSIIEAQQQKINQMAQELSNRDQVTRENEMLKK